VSCGIADRCDWFKRRQGDTVISGISTTIPWNVSAAFEEEEH